jgi:hypothetical protein
MLQRVHDGDDDAGGGLFLSFVVLSKLDIESGESSAYAIPPSGSIKS